MLSLGEVFPLGTTFLVWRKGFAVQSGTVGSILIVHHALYGPYGCKFYIPFGLRRGGRLNYIALKEFGPEVRSLWYVIK